MVLSLCCAVCLNIIRKSCKARSKSSNEILSEREMLAELCGGSRDSRLPHIELCANEFEAVSPPPTHKLFHNLGREYFECLYFKILRNFERKHIIKSITKFKRFKFAKESSINIHIIF